MKNCFLPLSLLALATLGCASPEASATKADVQSKPAAQPKPAPQPAPAALAKPAAQPTPEEMMAAMMRAGTPGAQHKLLDPFAGTWDAKVSMWMDPAAPATEATGTMVNTWIYDGRYLEQKFVGDMGGMPFEGTGLWGFDVAGGKYIGFWYDSMSTTVMHSSGPASKDGKTFAMESTATDPLTGKDSTGHEVISLDNPNQHTMTMYEDRGGKQVKTMQIVYTRKP